MAAFQTTYVSALARFDGGGPATALLDVSSLVSFISSDSAISVSGRVVQATRVGIANISAVVQGTAVSVTSASVGAVESPSVSVELRAEAVNSVEFGV